MIGNYLRDHAGEQGSKPVLMPKSYRRFVNAVKRRADRKQMGFVADEICGRAAFFGFVRLTEQDQAIIRLRNVNGRRRERTVDLEGSNGVFVAVWEAVRDGDYGLASGDVVANRYGYPAVRTCVVCAVRDDGSVRIGVGEGNANKNSSPITPVVPGVRLGAKSNAKARIRQWANDSIY